jgi:predicted TIM-barrel fold metal-dependent hydrolase
VCTLAADYSRVVDCAHELTRELSADERQWVFGLTAERVYLSIL